MRFVLRAPLRRRSPRYDNPDHYAIFPRLHGWDAHHVVVSSVIPETIQAIQGRIAHTSHTHCTHVTHALCTPHPHAVDISRTRCAHLMQALCTPHAPAGGGNFDGGQFRGEIFVFQMQKNFCSGATDVPYDASCLVRCPLCLGGTECAHDLQVFVVILFASWQLHCSQCNPPPLLCAGARQSLSWSS